MAPVSDMSDTLSVRLDEEETSDMEEAMRFRRIRDRSDFARQAIARFVADTKVSMVQFAKRTGATAAEPQQQEAAR